MTLPQHTPGPWVQQGNGSTYHGSNGEPVYVYDLQIPSLQRPTPEAIANKTLIAAAPDLLAALKECLLHVEASGFDPHGEVSRLVKKIIAKATGEKQ